MVNQEMLRIISLHFPSIAYDVIFCEYCDYGEWFIKNKDGACFVYDEYEKTIFQVAEYLDDLTEAECQKMFRRRLKKIMDWRRLSQKDLSEITGLHEVTISRYIRGRTVPNIFVLYILAKALECPMDDLLYFNVKGEQDV